MADAGLAPDWSVYDRPALRDTVSAATRGGREVLLRLPGMHCAACSARVEQALRGRATGVRVNLAARMVEFSFDPAHAALSSILGALDGAGFRPEVVADDLALRAEARARRAELARLGTSALLSMQVMMLAWPGYFRDAQMDAALAQLFRWAQWLLATPVVLYGGWPFFRGALLSLRARVPGMDLPVALALGIAYLVSAARTLSGHGELWFDSATMFVLFLSAGRYLEGRTRAEATRHLRLLAGGAPLTARRLDADGVRDVPAAELRAGDRVQVRSGEAVPVDGRLADAPAELDESLLTGESRPVRRQPGERLYAGSVNAGAAPLVAVAERVGADTHVSHIARLLNRAQASRPRFQQLADRYAGAFVLAVLLLAALGVMLAHGPDQALSAGLAVLVASCPCALSLALPAAVAACSSQIAERGALLVRPEALARLPRVDTVVFDKTGTLTEPQPRIVQVRPLHTLTEGRCLALAATLERDSAHPLARAFAEIAPLRATALRHDAGRGVAGTIEGKDYWLGAAEFAPLSGWTMPDDVEAGLSWILLASKSRALALIGLGAPPRREALGVARALRERGCEIELLTGDTLAAARPLAQRLGIARVQARVSAEDKLARIRALQAEGRVVMAVGDGINDAPVLAGADVAVAMPHGAALAQARADVILLGGNLAPLPALFEAARRATRVARQNLAWAFAYNVSVLPLAMAGLLPPWAAALGMAVSSLFVVLNARRLARAPRADRPRDFAPLVA